MIGFDSFVSLARIYHERHLVQIHSKRTADQLDYEVQKGKAAQAQAERLYGYPIDIDKVWEAREQRQNDQFRG